jgi:hypothetical protein
MTVIRKEIQNYNKEALEKINLGREQAAAVGVRSMAQAAVYHEIQRT